MMTYEVTTTEQAENILHLNCFHQKMQKNSLTG